MSETDKRWGDRAWDAAQKFIAISLCALCGHFYSRITTNEERIRTLEVKAAVSEESKSNIMTTLGEIKGQISALSGKLDELKAK